MNRNLRLIDLYTIGTNLVFILPTIVLYYKAIGLSFGQFLAAEAMFSATVLLAEAPTGLIADV